MRTLRGAILAAGLSFCCFGALASEYDVAAYVWPAYQPEPRWAELGIFGDGIGEWQNVKEAVPKWDGHRQPLVPLWGYENEADPKVVEKKIEAAVSHGVNVFIYDWYWYGGRPFLEDALDKGFLGAPNNGKMKFFVMWANHHVNWLWDNKTADKRWDSPRWRAWVGADEFRKISERWIVKYFSRPNYYRIGGKPVLMIYEVGTFVEGLGGTEKAAAALAEFRARCEKAGLGGVHVMACDFRLSREMVKALGIDSATIYNMVHWSNPAGNPDYSAWAEKGARRFDAARGALEVPAYFAHASVGWDTNPRYPLSSVQPTVLGSTPEKFEVALKRAKDWCDRNTPDGMPKLITVNSWNEWTEGSYLEPDTHFKFGYLEAVKRVFGSGPYLSSTGPAAASTNEAKANGAEGDAVVVQVRQTTGGPRIFVDGKAVRPRFFYGSPPCISPISNEQKVELIVPFRADEDTDCGRVRFDGFDGDEPMWFSSPSIEDVTSGKKSSLPCLGEERTRHFVRDGLVFRKGHLYRFHVTHRAVRPRTYFKHEVSYTAADGGRHILPLPYGDRLCDTVKMASDAEVGFITLSPDTSWGWEDWWAPEGGKTDYGKLDQLCEAVVAANPKALLVPRVSANAPAWMLARDPSIKMKFDKGYTIEMSSVSACSYRRAACDAVEKLARHLRAKFPRNFAGLQVTGQNSAEWFYMLSYSDQLSGYDVHTRDAFRKWLAARGENDADMAEVPTGEERRAVRPVFRWDPVKDRRVILFGQFRQEEMASFICELGAAVKKGTDGKSLACFFYGYTWELGGVPAGAAETGHFFVDWLTRHGRGVVDVLSGPVSYSDRAWPGSTPVMSAAETIMSRGILWFDEDDLRTHLEDLWTWPIMVGGFKNDSPWYTRNMLLRNSAIHILKGYGDWWMDLCGRGWFRDSSIWDVRRALNAVDDAMLARERPYSPEIAVVMDEESMMMNGWGSSAKVGPFCNRRGFETCGAPYGQYLLDDVLKNPPSAKLFYIAYAKDLSPERREKLDALAKRPGTVVFVADSAVDMTAEAIAKRARAAGVHLYAEPGKAVVCASEGYVVVQARREGPLELDFGDACKVSDALTSAAIGAGPKISVPFKKGETRVFKCN